MPIPKKAQPAAIGISIAVLAACITFIARECSDGGVQYTKEQLERLESNIGFSVQDIADRLGDKTGVLLLSIQVEGSKGLDESRAVAKIVLERAGKQVAEENINPVAEGMFFNPINWAMSWDDYNDAVLRHPDVEAVISIAGAPGITDEDDVALPDTYPPLYVAFSPGRQPDLGPLFDEGILAVAVVRNPMPGGHKGETPREQFDATFELVTTESEELPIFQAMP